MAVNPRAAPSPALYKRIGVSESVHVGPAASDGACRCSQVTVIEPEWLMEVAPHFYEVRIRRRRRRRRCPTEGVPPASPGFRIAAAGACGVGVRRGGHACVRIRERL